MERLTNKKEADTQRREYENRLKNGYPRNTPEERFLKLAAYEDTGLEPEEVAEYKHLCDSYVEAGLDAKFVQFCIDAAQNGLSVNKIHELAQAEKDGRLVVLPCKIGDTIFMAVGRYGITGFEEDRCDGFFINREGILQIKAQCYSGNHSTYGFPGETVFLTREEAEAALKKRGADTYV